MSCRTSARRTECGWARRRSTRASSTSGTPWTASARCSGPASRSGSPPSAPASPEEGPLVIRSPDHLSSWLTVDAEAGSRTIRSPDHDSLRLGDDHEVLRGLAAVGALEAGDQHEPAGDDRPDL